MSADPLSVTTYFAELAALAGRVGAEGISIYHSQYHMRAFGSWALEAERGHRCVKVVWDGKDGCLSLEIGVRPDSGAQVIWKRLPDQRISSGSYKEIFSATEVALVANVGT